MQIVVKISIDMNQNTNTDYLTSFLEKNDTQAILRLYLPYFEIIFSTRVDNG